MAGIKLVSVPHGDLGQGIDALSSEDAIPEGCSEAMVNADAAPEGYALKRPGYQGVWGFLPLRVSSLMYATDGTITFTFDRSVDLSGIQSQTHSRPVSAYGRTSSQNPNIPLSNQGDFPVGADASHWYPKFDADTRIALLAGTHTTTLPDTSTELATPYAWVGLATSTSPAALDNTQFIPDQVLTTIATEEVDIQTTLFSAQSAFAYFLPAPGVTGTSYKTGPTAVAPMTTYSTTILAATHGLDSPNIQVHAWDQQAGVLRDIGLDSVTLNAADDVTIGLTNNSSSTIQLVLSLSAAPVPNAVQGSFAGPGLVTATFTPPTPFTFVAAYTSDIAGVTRTQVLPDSVVYSSTSGQTTVSFTVADGTGAGQFFVYWQAVAVTTNQLTVTGATVPVAFTDTSPQISIWGLDQSLIYAASAADRAGWVTHLDTYRSEAEQFLVSGLGGNLFQGQAASPAVATQYGIPTLYPRLGGRVSSNTQLGPAFQRTGDSTARTRGWVRSDGATAAGFLRAASMVWDLGVGAVRVDIPLVNGSLSGTPISTVDQLTIQGAGYTRFNGSWNIQQVSLSVSVVTLWVAVTGVSSGLWDDLASGALVGVFTDSFSTGTNVGWLPGDTLLSDALPEGLPLTCVSSTGLSASFFGVTMPVLLSAGLIVVGRRTAQVLPLRTIQQVASVTGMVTGDNLALTGYDRQMRLYSVYPRATTSVAILADGSTATAWVAAGDTLSLAAGDRILITQAGAFSGEVVVTGMPTPLSFTFDTTLHVGNPVTPTITTYGAAVIAGGQVGNLQGNTVTLDESLVWEDSIDSSVTASVPGRWLPIEAPDTSGNEVPGPYRTYLDSLYDNQPILRSAQVTDSLMLNNGVDRPLKLDGSNVYRPGLTRWQPQLFMAPTTAVGSRPITIPDVHCSTIPNTGAGSIPGGTVLGWTAGSAQFNVVDGVQDTFQVGARIQVVGGSGTVYTVTQTAQASAVNASVTYTYGVITVDQAIAETPPSGATTETLIQTVTYSYYFRLNAVDANRNVVASAVTGSTDWTYVASADFGNNIRLIGLPAFANTPMDYDRLEVQIYRTKSNGVAPFYLLVTIPMSFDANDGYIDWTDYFDDDLLQDLDTVNTALKGQELGTTWSQPLRSKRITALGNRLVLANITSDPYLDLRLVNTGTPILSGELNGLRFLLKKDFEDTGTTTDMVNRVAYQMFDNTMTGESHTISAMSSVANTSFTLTIGANGLTVGSWVYLFRKATPGTNQQTHLMGWWQLTAVGATTVTIAWPRTPASLTAANEVDSLQACGTDPHDVPVWLGVDYNYQFSPEARFNTAPTTSDASNAATLRLANAINATQRMVNRALPGMASFEPWVCADAGGEFAAGQLVFRQPLSSTTDFGLLLPSWSGFNIYANDVQRQPGDTPTAVEQVRSSRVLVSYPNFSEIFDNPLSPVDSQSDSAIDVNPSDGQEITAVIPFFGDSTFGAAMKDSVLLVFKTQSIYLVNLAAKAAGQNPIQRLESMGLGATAPNSVAPTRSGIMFANESGIYRIDQAMTVYYMGRRLQRLWREQANLLQLDLVFGHNFSSKSQFHMSYPQLGSDVPNASFVYNSTREYSTQGITNTIQLYSTREGSWAQYVPAGELGSIGFANLLSDSYFASRLGRVFVRRNTGLPQDFRDDDQPVAMDLILRGMDFSDDGVRKSIPWAVVTYRNPQGQGTRTGTQVLSSVDLSDEWVPADATVLPDRPTNDAADDLGDTEGNRVVPYRYSFATKRGIRFSLRFTNYVKDEGVEITRIRYVVAGLTTPLGIREAASGPNPAANPPTGRG